MARVLIAGLIAMVIAVALGPQFIAWLRRQSIGPQIREEGAALIPLRPVSGNITQSAYALGNVATFLAIRTLLAPSGQRGR